ncbi:MAG: UvrB/UvrC motif-containing protein, partial [Oscillospiraceae bacterium]
ISETYRRREIQMTYNEEHGITPQTIRKEVREILEISSKDTTEKKAGYSKQMSPRERQELIKSLTVEMKNAAKILEFEHAAYLRDRIERIKTGKE